MRAHHHLTSFPTPIAGKKKGKANEPEHVYGEQVVDEQDEQVRAPKQVYSCGGLVFSIKKRMKTTLAWEI